MIKNLIILLLLHINLHFLSCVIKTLLQYFINKNMITVLMLKYNCYVYLQNPIFHVLLF